MALALLTACGGRHVERGYRPGELALVVPVEGVQVRHLRDSFHHSRSGGRRHYALDIPAPRGTPVLAAADGTILKLRTGGVGGVTIYQLAIDGRLRYYYAHLDRYRDGLKEGQRVRRGELIAYVGDTGNAGRGNYHLHFSIAILSDVKRYWEGVNLNPYDVLRASPVAR